jgi:DNA-binding NarL/FixJ family response regulator
MNSLAKAEILSRYRQHVDRFERDAASQRRLGLTVVREGTEETTEPTSTPGVLSAREAEVLALIARGLTDDGIAGKLGVSLFTVKTHVKKVLLKLAANNRAHAVAIAIRRGSLAIP